jgi:hypothetical protein
MKTKVNLTYYQKESNKMSNTEYFNQKMEFSDREISLHQKEINLFIGKVKRLEEQLKKQIELTKKYRLLANDCLELAERSCSKVNLGGSHTRDDLNWKITNDCLNLRRKINA